MNTRILLVEDDERLAELTAEYLSKNDLQVSIEPRGDTAEGKFNPDDWMEPKEQRKVDDFIIFAMAAARRFWAGGMTRLRDCTATIA